MTSEKRPSEWAYEIARDQRCDVETRAANLDAARAQGRREGLEEAFELATEHCDHGEWAHYGRFECIDALRVQIRARINKEPTA